MKIIDTHQHLWDLCRLRLPWLAGAPTLNRSFLSKDYLEATAGLEIEKTVYMEVDVSPDQQLAEAEYVFELCARGDNPMCAAVLSGRPASPDFADYLAVIVGSPYLRGIRQVLHGPGTPRGYCLAPEFIRGIRLLGEHGLSFDLCVRADELDDAAKLIASCPETRFILDHCGNANVQSADRTQWFADLQFVSQYPNVVCKISGIVASARPGAWTAGDLAPIVNHCLNEFGQDRVMFGGDWPVCTLASTYRQWVEALREIVKDRPEWEQRKLFRDNAVAYYALEPLGQAQAAPGGSSGETIGVKRMSKIAKRAADLELTIPDATPGKLAPAVRTGNLVYTSGAVSATTGKVGGEVSVEQGYEAARSAILGCLGSVQWLIGDLDKVKRVVKLLGMVNCAEGFTNTPAVIHGATDTLIALFGEQVGWHARSAIGVYQLPGNVSVEIELIVEVAD